MKISEYFKNVKGRGVLATADAEGRVDGAIYASPHIMDEETVAFIMRDRLTHSNIQSNPHAAYIFSEDGPAYKGMRLFLTKIREEQDTELLFSLRRRDYRETDKERGPLFLVFFKVDKVLPLIGVGDEE
ncbi:MAG: pyridoxamine 5'-phosphate oxidase family protein [Deltaproteobacteria bacterium]|nr:pyridoxamine 5'-phosphate oxidase family protein [Deltaproteobacteria bacterium]